MNRTKLSNHKGTPYLAVVGELWGISYVDFWAHWYIKAIWQIVWSSPRSVHATTANDLSRVSEQHWSKMQFRMMTSSNGNIFRVTGHLCGEFTGPRWFPAQRLVTRSFDVFFDLRLNKRLSKQSWGWWFETLSRPWWRHRNAKISIISS